MFPYVSSNSIIPELLSVIKLSFERKEHNGKVCDEAERVLICQVEDLINEVGDLKSDVSILKTERELLEDLSRSWETEKINVKEKLKKREVECETYRNAVEEVKKAETEGLRTIVELKRKNKELEEEITCYRDDFQQRISNVEEIVAGLLGKDVSDVRKGNHDNLNSCRSSMMVRSSGGNRHSHEHNQDLAVDCDIDVCDIKSEIASLVAAAAGPNTPIYIIDTDDETSADELAVIAKTNGVKLNSSMKEISSVKYKINSVKIEEINGAEDSSFDLLYSKKRIPSSGDEVNRSVRSKQKGQDTPDKSAVIAKTDDVKLNSSLKDSCFDKADRSKTSHEANRQAINSQMTQDTGVIFFHGGKGSIINGFSTNDKSVAFRTEGSVTPRKRPLEINYSQFSIRRRRLTDYSDCNSTDLDNDLAASDSNIDYTIAKLRKKTWNSAEDLVSAFEKNDELCMKAVCVLYRRTIFEKKLTNDPSIPSTLGLSHFLAMGGNELAELLAKGDHKHILKSSVAEVNEKCTEVLERCRQLAIHYNEILFEIYRKGVDPFFCCACL